VDLETEIEHAAEELFPPKPGGAVDTARREREVQAVAEEHDANDNTYDPVRVRLGVPDVASATTIVVATGDTTGGIRRLAGRDGERYWACVLTLDQPVVLCFSRAAAEDPRNAGNAAGQSAGGFVVPVGVPVPVQASSEIWVAATSSTATRVSFYRQSFGS
jgi:hypothetical protein